MNQVLKGALTSLAVTCGIIAGTSNLLRNDALSTELAPYLFFAGRCEEALAFYEKALGAKTEFLMRFSDSPTPPPEGTLQAGFENKVMHASLYIDGLRLMASDGCDDRSTFDGFKLALSVPTEATAHQYFNGLAEGGTIDMPLAKTFWSPCYGMVTDKFGVSWMVMVQGDPS